MIVNPDFIYRDKVIVDLSKNSKANLIGIDLSIKEIKLIEDKYTGRISKDGTWIDKSVYKPCISVENYYLLESGVYSVTFEQEINLPNNMYGVIISRSSLLRLGSQIEGGIYEPGFKTNNIGSTLFVNRSISLEIGCCICQMCFFECFETKGYQGRWQGEKDFK